MRTLSRRFFFYGTLIAGTANAVARHVHARLRPLGPALARGKLLALFDESGWYPALLEGEGLVSGAVYETSPDFVPDDLAVLDAYEGAEYERRPILAEGIGEAEAYWWAGPLPLCGEPIPGGDFSAWLVATGRRAFASQGPVNLRR